MMNDHSHVFDAEGLFGEIADYLENAQAHLAAENMASLASLNETVGALGNRVAALPADVAADYAPEIAYLVEQMQGLCSAMTQKRGALTHDLEVADKRLRALQAYHSAPRTGV